MTINDVAAAAGVSRQTVSRAMNGMAEINAETRDRVLRASEELGYRPSRFAANLARQKHHSIGLVLRTLRNPYYTDLAADFLVESVARGWQTSIATTEGADESTVLASLVEHVDVLVGYFDGPEQAILRAVRGTPTIFVERSATSPGIQSLGIDFEAGMRSLVEGLLERGVRSIAMIDSRRAPSEPYAPTRRRLAFEQAAAALDVDSRVVFAEETPEQAGTAFAELHRSGARVDAVIAFNDLMAMGVLQRAAELGVRVPDDLRVVGIDGLSLGALMTPTLSTLAIDRVGLSAIAGGLIADALTGEQHPSTARTVMPHPLWRISA